MITATIKDISVGDRDYIWLNIEFNVDGKVVYNKYPLDFKNVIGKTSQEITEWVDANINYQIERYIEAEFRRKANLDIIAKTINGMVGRNYSKDIAELVVDNATIIAKTDGTYTIKAN